MKRELVARDGREQERHAARNSLDKYCNEIRKTEVFDELMQQSKDELVLKLRKIRHWNEGTIDEYLQERKYLEKWVEVFIYSHSN